MRITNKMMTQNSLSHINTIKGYEDDLTTQMSTGKKITRASEDPVIAIRALRLRSAVTETTQYYKYNAADAGQWLSITESSLDDVTDLLAEAIRNMEKGANSYLQSSDRMIIADQLDSLVDEIYTAGNSDYAGRYIFTGYRTDTSLSFTSNEEIEYDITEFFTKDDIETIAYVGSGPLDELTKSNYKSSLLDDTMVESVAVNRLRLSYDQLSATQDASPVIEYTDSLGVRQTIPVTVKSIGGQSDSDVEGVYYGAGMAPMSAVLIPETGELILGNMAADELTKAQDINFTYKKQQFSNGDLRPEHYFACSAKVEGEIIDYNIERDMGGNIIKPGQQVITYDVGANQSIRVNSVASECFTHDLGITASELRSALERLQMIEDKQKMLDELKEGTTDPSELTKIEKLYTATSKAFDLQKAKVQAAFENAIAKFQVNLDEANLALTSCGTRSSKLELISNRLQSQKTQTEELKSNNEDVDITETAVLLTSANTTYEAALRATSKIMQSSLLNYM